jgi:hypothetical protein
MPSVLSTQQFPKLAARKLLTLVLVMLKQNLDYWDIEERLYNQKLRDLQQAA